MSSHGTCAPSPGLAVTREHQNRKVRHCRLVLHTGESRITLSTCDRHEGVSRRCGEHYAAWNLIQPNRFGTLTAVRYRDEILRLSHLTLVQWTLGISWCRTVPGLMWPECVGSSWMMKGIEATDRLPCSSDLNPIAAMGRYVSRTATNCPGAHWFPDPGLGGDPLGHHPPTHQEHIWWCGGLETLLSRTMSCCDKIHASWISLWFKGFTFGVILNPAHSGLMILVSTDRCHVILYSTNYTLYSSEDFHLE